MRFVQLTVKEEAVQAFRRFYDFRVAPAIAETPGCLFVRLIQSDATPTEFISFSLWRAGSDAAAYETSGDYEQIVKEGEEFQEESSEWKIQLADDMTLQYLPVREKPEVKTLPVVASSESEERPPPLDDQVYVRILSVHVAEGRFNELSAYYDDVLIPELLAVPGCRAAYLIGVQENDEALSITVWDNRQAAAAYEDSGTFMKLLKMASPMLSSLIQWKLTLDPNKQESTRTSDDVTVQGYHMVRGEKL